MRSDQLRNMLRDKFEGYAVEPSGNVFDKVKQTQAYLSKLYIAKMVAFFLLVITVGIFGMNTFNGEIELSQLDNRNDKRKKEFISDLKVQHMLNENDAKEHFSELQNYDLKVNKLSVNNSKSNAQFQFSNLPSNFSTDQDFNSVSISSEKKLEEIKISSIEPELTKSMQFAPDTNRVIEEPVATLLGERKRSSDTFEVSPLFMNFKFGRSYAMENSFEFQYEFGPGFNENAFLGIDLRVGGAKASKLQSSLFPNHSLIYGSLGLSYTYIFNPRGLLNVSARISSSGLYGMYDNKFNDSFYELSLWSNEVGLNLMFNISKSVRMGFSCSYSVASFVKIRDSQLKPSYNYFSLGFTLQIHQSFWQRSYWTHPNNKRTYNRLVPPRSGL